MVGKILTLTTSIRASSYSVLDAPLILLFSSTKLRWTAVLWAADFKVASNYGKTMFLRITGTNMRRFHQESGFFLRETTLCFHELKAGRIS